MSAPAARDTDQPFVVFAGGGTGGHLTPSLAVLDKLDAHGAGFICSHREIDARVLGAAGARFEPIHAAPWSLRPRGAIRFAWRWGGAVRRARALLQGEPDGWRRPAAVVSTGGFVSAPVAQAARVEGLPLISVNLDASLGKANRFFGRGAARRLIVGGEAPGWETIRPIVRTAVREAPPADEARRELGLDPARRTLLVTGGSQGARSLNQAMASLVRAEPAAFDGWQVIHQCGAGAESELSAAYDEAGVRARVDAFVARMDLAWSAADAAVSRAGASAVAEAWATRTPTVFLPYPFHRNQHQRLNAEPLERAGAGVIVEDRIEPGATMPSLRGALVPLLEHDAARAEKASSIDILGPADGADTIARAVAALR